MNDIDRTLRFAQENDLCVIPIKHKGKCPRVAWKKYQQRKPSSDEIKEWFEQDSNIAFVCGSVSGGTKKAFVVIDFDDEEIYKIFYPDGGPDTRTVKTSKGYHVYFFTPVPIPKFRIEIEKEGKPIGIDVQGEGGYVICPPSIHPSGVTYKWVNDKPIRFLKDEFPSHFKACLLHRIDCVCVERGWKRRGADKHDIQRILQGVKSGERNLSAYFLTSYYKQLGRSKIESEELLERWNERCEPPLPYTELMSIVTSAFKPNAKTGFDFGLEIESWVSKFFTENGKPKVKEISEDIKSRHAFVCIKDTEELYRYNPQRGIYETGGEMVIKSECKSNFGNIINQYWVREILAYIQATTYIRREELNSQSKLLHLQNGIFDMDTYKLRPFTPDVMSTVSLPIFYDSKAKCPGFDKFLNEVAKQRDIQLIKELFGYCLHKSYEIHKFFLFAGRGSN
ncbi:MAG: bifunctional DNA primase/polymerase [Methanomassiliicoccales archaeon]|nr:MAG: bifunctional DNA primase/polymerase [Methanomassiliicoccales archaeon]